ncbi:MAG: T9SS type A sorting domain-containing protein [Bacteroidetes bacterium]|nr:T9SS type A sorting domain-containing protein [Bacteroidota bacterium]
MALNLQAQTYTWNRTDSADFQVASNWTPDRTTPAATDVLVFNNGATGTVVYNIPATQTIAGFQLSNNTFVRITNGSTTLITISGGTGPQFSIGAGSTLEVCGAATKDSIGFNLTTGTTASISGIFTMKSYGGTPGHRFRVKDASGATFNNGSVFTFGPAVAGNSFGAAANASSGNNSVVFASGSRYILKAGANPFAQSTPNSFVVFNSGSTYEHQSTGAPSLSGRTFANFEMNAAGYNTGSTGGGTFTVENLTVTDATSFGINLTGRINIKGNISIAAGKTLAFSPATADTLYLNGTSNQTINGAGTLTFGTGSRILVNNSAGITLNRNVILGGELNMQSGNITTGANILTLGSGTSALGTLVYTSGTIIGNFERWFAASTVSNVLYPVGTTTDYRPFTVSFPTVAPVTGGTIIVSHTDGTDGSDLTVPINDGGFNITRRSNMFWTLTAANGLAGGTYDLSIDGNGQNGINDANNLRAIYSTDGTVFSVLGTHAVGTGTVANRTGIIGGLPGSFYLGGNSTNNPLPVELDNFVATTIKNEVILDWATGHELNNTGFEIERAVLTNNQNGTDADVNFQTVAFVASKGNSNNVQGYKYIDGNLLVGRFAYRLKQIDYNGNHTYFLLNNEVIVASPNKFAISQNYPNPFNPATKIAFEMPFDGNVKIVVFDNLGREVKTLVNGNVNAGYNKVDFNASGLPSGIYFYRINAVSGTEKYEKVFKMMLVK